MCFTDWMQFFKTLLNMSTLFTYTSALCIPTRENTNSKPLKVKKEPTGTLCTVLILQAGGEQMVSRSVILTHLGTLPVSSVV